jgi:hypothetical protein
MDGGRVARRAELGKQISRHTLRHAFITAALEAGVPLRDVQEAASHADPHHHARLRDSSMMQKSAGRSRCSTMRWSALPPSTSAAVIRSAWPQSPPARGASRAGPLVASIRAGAVLCFVAAASEPGHRPDYLAS